jgi:hypothetical protein
MNLLELCLCSGTLWKREFKNDNLGYLKGEMSKEQSVQGAARFLFSAYNKSEKRKEIW